MAIGADPATLTQLRAWVAHRAAGEGGRLPPERELADMLGVTRGGLRKALKVLEDEGALWRQVGKGTFVGMRPVDEFGALGGLAAETSPGEVMHARLRVEPLLAFEAGINASANHIADLDRAIAAARAAETWREYEACDNRFHRTVAEATGNRVLTALFDQLNAIRRTVVWGRARERGGKPPASHHSHAEHEHIRDAIRACDPAGAREAMEAHLRAVTSALGAAAGDAP